MLGLYGDWKTYCNVLLTIMQKYETVDLFPFQTVCGLSTVKLSTVD